MSPGITTEALDAALEQLLQAVAEETAGHRSAKQLLADAEARLAQMEADCAEAIEQYCRLAEDRIAADRLAAEKRGRLAERTWVLGLIGLMLEGLQEGGAAAASLQSLRRMVEEGPIKIGVPCSELVG
jgi:type VI protein secretion system component VasK